MTLGEMLGILANFGVIAGIVFLAYEIRQNTVSLKSSVSQNIYTQISQLLDKTMDAQFAEIMLRGQESFENLSQIEKVQYSSYLGQSFQAWQNIYFQVRAGAYDAKMADGWWQVLKNSLLLPGFRECWENSSQHLSSEFRDFVATKVMTRDPTPNYQGFYGESED